MIRVHCVLQQQQKKKIKFSLCEVALRHRLARIEIFDWSEGRRLFNKVKRIIIVVVTFLLEDI